MAGLRRGEQPTSEALEGNITYHPADQAAPVTVEEPQVRPQTIPSYPNETPGLRPQQRVPALPIVVELPRRPVPLPHNAMVPKTVMPSAAVSEPRAVTPPPGESNIAPYYPQPEKRRWLIPVVALGILAVGSGAAWEVEHYKTTSHPQVAAELPQQNDSTLPTETTTPTPTPTDISNLLIITPESTATTAPKKSAISKPSQKGSVKATTSPLTTSQPSRRSTSHPKLIHIPQPVLAPPVPTSTPRPTPSEVVVPTNPEATAPSPATLDALRGFIDQNRLASLQENYQNIDQYLNLDGMIASGEVQDVSPDTIDKHQKLTKSLYQSADVRAILGDSVAWLSEDSLHQSQATGDNPITQLLAQTDNALRGAQAVYPFTGDKIANLPFLNNQLVDEAKNQLHNNGSLWVPDAQNATLLDVELRVRHGVPIAYAAVSADYISNGQTSSLIIWKILEPTDDTGKFIGVTAGQVEITPQPVAPPDSSPTDTPTDTPTPTDTSSLAPYFEKSFHSRRQNSQD